MDPLQTLQAALNAEPNSKAQAEILASLREGLENQPAPIRVLVPILISNLVNSNNALLKSWVIDLFHFGICRSSLSLDVKTQLSSQTLDTLFQLLDDHSPSIVKVVIQCLATVYPLLFRSLCSNRNNPAIWTVLSNCKNKILGFVGMPGVNAGVRISALKFMQRVILVQVPQGISDPRLQNKNDPNLSFCPANHPFISVSQLEAEGQSLLKKVIEILYSSQSVDLLSALLNSWATLVKMRPNMIPLVVTALKSWTPAALIGLPASAVRSAEKAVRILLTHISRISTANQFIPQINEALSTQASRMESAASEEKKRRAAIAAGVTPEPKKRPPTAEGLDRPDIKRVKLEEPEPYPHPHPQQPNPSVSLLASFDFSTLPATLITDLIVANIEAFTEPALMALVHAYRQSNPPTTSSLGFAPHPPVPGPSSLSLAPTPTGESQKNRRQPDNRPHSPTPIPQIQPPAPIPVPLEPVDPLQMDIDQDELEYEPDRLNEELSGSVPPPEEASASSLDAPTTTTTTRTDTSTPESSKINHSYPFSSSSPLDLQLPSPKDLSTLDERIELISKSIVRIYEGSLEMRWNSSPVAPAGSDGLDATIGGPMDMWMLLVVRMITRVVEPPKDLLEGEDDASVDSKKEKDALVFYESQDRLRKTLCDYIMSDFPGRIRLATTWMNEEWYNDQVRLERNPDWRPNYDIWLSQIVALYQTHLDGKDRTFARFLLDLPSVPADVLSLLRELCVENESPEKMQIGFSTLRGFVRQRPLMRADALNVLLELTTHTEKKIRGAAINTVKLWVPNHQPMYGMIREFALQILRKLQQAPVVVPKSSPASLPPVVNGDEKSMEGVVNGDAAHESVKVEQESLDETAEGSVPTQEEPEEGQVQDESMEEEQLPLIHTPFLPERIELPADKSHVLQHVELLFALSVKVPDFLDELFLAYGQMDITVQEAIQELITALVRSLGSSHGKLLTLMRTCPPEASSLALLALVKGLINEQDLDARFLIPIIAEMDKPDIIRHLPRIVSTLNGKPEAKALVRSVFGSIVTTPPQTFGSVTSNMPRVRQSELLTPAELMVLLHDSEKEIGIPSAKEAIGICFSMTDVFRSEILAVVMQQIMDEPVLPILFLRTVIQAVTTYKSLIKFVSTTLLSRLITKKIWTIPPLWEGFIHCAKVIAPASFGALLQLPKDQLRELVDRQPNLKAGLRDFVTKKAPNKARVSGFLDIFSESPVVEDAVPGELPVRTQSDSIAGSESA
ncbi:Symplekin tight junction protein C terminal-domain-containing protein [Rhodocollybia butyracea]|uniref:Symplekin tight junction protein C terminal-domain-containing protein n=1 Tax=Rhodocollybia butyracea TaxID=206335 RepID=A0A9P5UAQ9_9AGAR|nr:Symplekin tight junction protein C terminal-domain-containing protein [Rhodocollybia butyracea]